MPVITLEQLIANINFPLQESYKQELARLLTDASEQSWILAADTAYRVVLSRLDVGKNKTIAEVTQLFLIHADRLKDIALEAAEDANLPKDMEAFVKKSKQGRQGRQGKKGKQIKLNLLQELVDMLEKQHLLAYHVISCRYDKE